MKRSSVLVSLILLSGLTSCMAMPGDSLGGDRPWVPPVPVGGQSQPRAIPGEMYTGEVQPVQPVQEKHGVTLFNKCREMLQRFKREGRKINLVDIQRNPNPGATLRFICIFEGEDAEEGYYHDTRYNNPQEYQ